MLYISNLKTHHTHTEFAHLQVNKHCVFHENTSINNAQRTVSFSSFLGWIKSFFLEHYFYILSYFFHIESNYKYMQIYNSQTISIRSSRVECKSQSHRGQNICMAKKQVSFKRAKWKHSRRQGQIERILLSSVSSAFAVIFFYMCGNK